MSARRVLEGADLLAYLDSGPVGVAELRRRFKDRPALLEVLDGKRTGTASELALISVHAHVLMQVLTGSLPVPESTT